MFVSTKMLNNTLMFQSSVILFVVVISMYVMAMLCRSIHLKRWTWYPKNNAKKEEKCCTGQDYAVHDAIFNTCRI